MNYRYRWTQRRRRRRDQRQGPRRRRRRLQRKQLLCPVAALSQLTDAKQPGRGRACPRGVSQDVCPPGRDPRRDRRRASPRRTALESCADRYTDRPTPTWARRESSVRVTPSYRGTFSPYAVQPRQPDWCRAVRVAQHRARSHEEDPLARRTTTSAAARAQAGPLMRDHHDH